MFDFCFNVCQHKDKNLIVFVPIKHFKLLLSNIPKTKLPNI